MRINAHAHVHPFASLFTRETLDILLARLGRQPLPDVLVEQAQALLVRFFEEAGARADPEVLLRRWLDDLAASDAVRARLEALAPAERVQFDLVGADLLREAGVRSLAEVLAAVHDRLRGDRDARRHGLGDLVEFLYDGLQPSVQHVTRRLMAQQPDGGAVVALAMDITEGDAADRLQYLGQLRDTAAEILRYPGRFFPFVCVNTRREDHFEIMERALVGQGFVGVKVYPSLGYRVDSQAMQRVAAYCAERDVPIVTHCSRGGYYRNEQARSFADPAHWRPLLEAHPGLKVCFAHFGGATNLVQETIPPDSWTQTILDLMRAFEGVYADLSFHDEPMDGGSAETHYFRHLEALLGDAVTGKRVLFGSDWFLVRLRLREENYWAYFTERLSAPALRRLTEANPARFLGFGPGAALSWPLERYVEVVAEQAPKVEARPAPWLLEAVRARFGDAVTFDVSDFGPAWTANNEAHFRVYRVLRRQQFFSHQRERLRFAEAGAVRVRELQYWNKEHEAPALFQRKAEALAEQLDVYFRANGADYEAGVDRAAAVRRLAEAFRDGTTRLVDLGTLADALYRFHAEADDA